LCATLGWCELTDTKLHTVCPDGLQNYSCQNVINAWSGAAADTASNNLYIWGGGHSDYSGNEMYALDLNAVKMKRLNDPSPESARTACEEVYSDGLPASRHTYDGLSFFPDTNLFFAFGGSRSACGYLADDTWLFSPATLTWARSNDSGPPAAAPGVMTDYDAATGKIFLHDSASSLYSYDLATRSYTLIKDNVGVDYHLTGRYDPVHQLWVMIGNHFVKAISMAPGSNHELLDWDNATTGCDGLLAAGSPGFTFDPDQGLFVGWAGGSDVYTFDASTKVCTKKSYPGGPGPTPEQGTFGRFRYFPKLKVFAAVANVDEDAYTLRMIP
jgi:hypothetical protein